MIEWFKTDGIFFSKWLSKFIKQLSLKAKCNIVEYSIYLLFYIIKKKLNYCPLYFFFECIEQVRPIIGIRLYTQKFKKEIKILKVIPYQLKGHSRYNKAAFWVSKSVYNRKETEFIMRIFNELYGIVLKYGGESLKKKKECYEQAFLSKAAKKFKW